MHSFEVSLGYESVDRTTFSTLKQHAHSRTAVRVSRRINIMHVLLKEPYVRARKEPVEAL